MMIKLPEEFKDNYWDRKLCIIRKSSNSFLIYDCEVKESISKRITKSASPDSLAFNRFILSGIFETRSANDLLELPEAFEDFSKCETSFSTEKNSILVSKV